jgi:hypothetical protein
MPLLMVMLGHHHSESILVYLSAPIETWIYQSDFQLILDSGCINRSWEACENGKIILEVFSCLLSMTICKIDLLYP